ncbi:MAG: chromate transporter [Oscillospiraceae bacterium]|nr:chromate transporter [Oscillospiraceae bacterium]
MKLSSLFRICFEFFKTGLFSVGGGLATLPFLVKISDRYPEWFSHADLANMVAVAESTPGPIGINMSTYAGYFSHGVIGGILTTLSLVFPSFLVVLLVSKIWEKYKKNEKVQKTFSSIRAAAIGLLLSACFSVFVAATFPGTVGVSAISLERFKVTYFMLFIVFFILMNNKKLKKVHPIAYIFIGAVVGIVFSL